LTHKRIGVRSLRGWIPTRHFLLTLRSTWARWPRREWIPIATPGMRSADRRSSQQPASTQWVSRPGGNEATADCQKWIVNRYMSQVRTPRSGPQHRSMLTTVMCTQRNGRQQMHGRQNACAGRNWQQRTKSSGVWWQPHISGTRSGGVPSAQATQKQCMCPAHTQRSAAILIRKKSQRSAGESHLCSMS
jgi:hypothetical protein